jgi:hypothetical protein
MNQQNELPVAYTVFCDDVRQEVGNKVSYMGVYQGALFVQAFPLVLAKFCAAITVRYPRDSQPSSLVFKLLLQDKVIAERSFDPSMFVLKQNDEQGVNVVSATALFQVVPFSLEEPALLKARAYFDHHELKAGALTISSLQATIDPPPE